MTASGIVLPTVTWPLPRSRIAGRSPRASPTAVPSFSDRNQIGRCKNRHPTGKETAVIVHRLEPAVGDRKNIRHARVDAGYRIDPRLGFHDRRVQPGFKGRRMVCRRPLHRSVFRVSNCSSRTIARLIRGVIKKRSLSGMRALTWPKPSTSCRCARIRLALTMSFLS